MKTRFYQRKKNWLILLISLVMLYALLGYFLLPKFITQQLKLQLDATYSMQVDVAQVFFNPFTFKTELVDVKLTDMNSQTWYQSDSTSIDFDPTELITGKWHFSALHLNEAVVDVTTDNTGKVTVPALPGNMESTTASAPIDLAINNIIISDGRINLQADHIKQNYALSLQDIQIALDQFALNDDNSEFKLSITTENDEEMTFNGSFNFVNQHIMSQFTLNNVAAQSFNDMLPNEALMDIQSGLIAAQGFINWQFSEKPNIKLDIITVEGIAAVWQPGIKLNDFQASLNAVSVDTQNHLIDIESITSNAANWQVSLPLNDTLEDEKITESTAFEQTWMVHVGQINASNWPITWHTQSQPLDTHLLQFEASGINNDSESFNWQAEFSLANEAHLKLNSETNLMPLNIQSELELNSLNLMVLQPWLQPLSNWQFSKGILNTQQLIAFDGSELTMQGKLDIKQGMIVNDLTQTTAQWQLLEIGAVTASNLSRAVIFDQISIDAASGKLPDVPVSKQITGMESASTINPGSSKTNNNGWTIQIGDTNNTDKKH